MTEIGRVVTIVLKIVLFTHVTQKIIMTDDSEVRSALYAYFFVTVMEYFADMYVNIFITLRLKISNR